jgi:RHS repeat-associated protein
VSGITYDANGNLQTMTQRGFTVGGSSPIDSLFYGYLGSDSSNKLTSVRDSSDNANSLLGDFHYNQTTKQSTDYAYDGNGNLTKDYNKVIDNMTYNFLNLPQLVHLKGEGNISYTYDAAGNKLAKVIADSVAGLTTTITYVGGLVYQQRSPLASPGSGTDTLQFIVHEEGRARWAYHKYVNGTTAYKLEFDFFERDHLGNTRTVLTQQRDTSNYLATMESAYRATELQLFGNIGNTSAAWTSMPNYVSIPSGTRTAYTNPNDSVSIVDSTSSGGQKVGPNLLLKVMSGDTVNLSAQCYYVAPGGGSTNYSSFSDVLNSLGNGLVNLTGGAHGNLGNLTGSGSSVYTGLSSFLGSFDTAHSGFPKAYINWIFLDDQFTYVSSLSGSVLAASSTYPAGTMNLVAPGGPITLNRSGYLYIWVSNETSGWNVYFDNLSVQHKQGPLLEENHYYPFGLTMAGISDKAMKTNYSENKYRYNSGNELQNKEFSDGSGLELYDAGFRQLDPQLGRFAQIDPLSERTDFSSAYQYANNNPISMNDPTGLRAADNRMRNAGIPLSYTRVTQEQIYGTYTFGGGGTGDGGAGGGGAGDGGGGGQSGASSSSMTFNNYWSTLVSYLQSSPDGTTWNCSQELTGAVSEVSDQAIAETQSSSTTNADQSSFNQLPIDVLIVASKVNGSADVGHTAIKIGGKIYGYYPSGSIIWSAGEEHVNSPAEFDELYLDGGYTDINLKVTASEYNKIQSALDELVADPGHYSMFGNQCTSEACSILENAGLNLQVWSGVVQSGAAFSLDSLWLSPSSFKDALLSNINNQFFVSSTYHHQ